MFIIVTNLLKAFEMILCFSVIFIIWSIETVKTLISEEKVHLIQNFKPFHKLFRKLCSLTPGWDLNPPRTKT